MPSAPLAEATHRRWGSDLDDLMVDVVQTSTGTIHRHRCHHLPDGAPAVQLPVPDVAAGTLCRDCEPELSAQIRRVVSEGTETAMARSQAAIAFSSMRTWLERTESVTAESVGDVDGHAVALARAVVAAHLWETAACRETLETTVEADQLAETLGREARSRLRQMDPHLLTLTVCERVLDPSVVGNWDRYDLSAAAIYEIDPSIKERIYERQLSKMLKSAFYAYWYRRDGDVHVGEVANVMLETGPGVFADAAAAYDAAEALVTTWADQYNELIAGMSEQVWVRFRSPLPAPRPPSTHETPELERVALIAAFDVPVDGDNRICVAKLPRTVAVRLLTLPFGSDEITPARPEDMVPAAADAPSEDHVRALSLDMELADMVELASRL